MSNDNTTEIERLDPACAAALDEAAAYALGECSLSAPTRLHILRCPPCQKKLEEYQAVRQLLPLSAPQSEPSAALRTRLLDAVAQEQNARVSQIAAPPVQPTQPKVKQQPRRQTPAWSLIISLATALSLLLMMISWNVVLQEQVSRQDTQLANSREGWDTLISLMNDPTLQVATLNGTNAHGTLWSAPARDNGCLMLENLPPLAAGQRYQLWLNNQGQWASGGIFQGRDGKSWFITRPGQTFDHFTQVLVTVEPTSGSTQPKGPIVVQGTLEQGSG